MREGWKEVTLGEICTKIGDGLHGTPKYDDLGEYYFINGNNLGNGKVIIHPSTNKISKVEYEKIRKELSNRTILLGINGTIGNLGFYNNEKVALGKSACYLNLKNDIDKFYIRYVLEFDDFQKYAQLFATGSTIRNLGLKAIRSYKFILPSLETQGKIASILSGYDDLIENNLKRIKILEEMAQQTYEEWFVRVRFPGFETVEMKDGLPMGWEKVKLGEACNLVMGQSPKSEDYNVDGNGLPFHQGVKDYGYRFPINKSWSTSGNKKAIPNSILFSVRAPVGRLNVASEEIILGRGLASINHKNALNSFLYYQLRTIFFEDNLIGGGAIYASVTKTDVERIELISAGKIAEKFNNYASKIDLEILNLTSQNQRLRESRGILLPRLMMGIIDVENLNSEKEPVKIIALEKPKKEVSKEFKEAVLIAVLTERFGSEKYPLGRKRYTKLSYLFHRYADNKIQDYLRKAAGPYNPKTKYGGPEKIALNSNYIQNWKSDNKMTGFVIAEKIEAAKNYFPHYWQVADLDWLTNEFKYKSNDELELLATVDNSLVELAHKNMDFNTANVLAIIKSEKEWEAKLERTVFNDANVERAIGFLRGILEYQGQ